MPVPPGPVTVRTREPDSMRATAEARASPRPSDPTQGHVDQRRADDLSATELREEGHVLQCAIPLRTTPAWMREAVLANSVDYARPVALLIEAVKEQQQRIEALEASLR